MDERELSFLCFLHAINGIGNKTLWSIKKSFGSFQACFEANANQLYSSVIAARAVENLLEKRHHADPELGMAAIRSMGVQTMTIEDDYPENLANIFDPPYIFYYIGKIEILKPFCLAVVGSRFATPYGKTQASRFGKELAENGITVVSGLARGVDTRAHQGAIEAGGSTVGVLGSGIDVIYPQENRGLYHEMCEKGLIISEFPLHTSPEPGNFPMRNRTISGLSRGVLVVEAKSRSGALITADFALEQGRDVFAIPGPISSKNSEGTNRLIKQGAILVSHIDDILEEYGMPVAGTNSEMNLQGELFLLDNKEIMVIKCMGYDPLHFDEILTATHSTIGELSASLMKMEAKGIIKGMPGNYYVKL